MKLQIVLIFFQNIFRIVFGTLRLVVPTAALMLLFFDFSGCFFATFRYSDADVNTFFQEKKIPHHLQYFQIEGRKIRTLTIGNDTTLPTILLIHGAPSSLSVFNAVLSDERLYQKARLIAIDRAGYGYSGLGKAEVSIEKQARLIRTTLDSIRLNKNQPLFIAGFSFGGPIAAKMQMLDTTLADGLLLGAPAIAPNEEKIYRISYLTQHWYSRWLFPRMLQSASDEKFAHAAELTKMLPDWSKIRIPVVYMQGENDELVYTSNAQFAKEKLVNVPSLEINMIPNQRHFLSGPQHDFIVQKLLEMCQQINHHQ